MVQDRPDLNQVVAIEEYGPDFERTLLVITDRHPCRQPTGRDPRRASSAAHRTGDRCRARGPGPIRLHRPTTDPADAHLGLLRLTTVPATTPALTPATSNLAPRGRQTVAHKPDTPVNKPAQPRPPDKAPDAADHPEAPTAAEAPKAAAPEGTRRPRNRRSRRLSEPRPPRRPGRHRPGRPGRLHPVPVHRHHRHVRLPGLRRLPLLQPARHRHLRLLPRRPPRPHLRTTAGLHQARAEVTARRPVRGRFSPLVLAVSATTAAR
jgi:hypothetical protein